jgi:hypothetical protein
MTQLYNSAAPSKPSPRQYRAPGAESTTSWLQHRGTAQTPSLHRRAEHTQGAHSCTTTRSATGNNAGLYTAQPRRQLAAAAAAMTDFCNTLLKRITAQTHSTTSGCGRPVTHSTTCHQGGQVLVQLLNLSPTPSDHSRAACDMRTCTHMSTALQTSC